jgi:hypothetical protein
MPWPGKDALPLFRTASESLPDAAFYFLSLIIQKRKIKNKSHQTEAESDSQIIFLCLYRGKCDSEMRTHSLDTLNCQVPISLDTVSAIKN